MQTANAATALSTKTRHILLLTAFGPILIMLGRKERRAASVGSFPGGKQQKVPTWGEHGSQGCSCSVQRCGPKLKHTRRSNEW